MYVDGDAELNLPSIYDGLPIDGDTIYWEITKDGRVLKAKSTGGSGGSGDIDTSQVVSIITNAGFVTKTWVRNALSDYVNITDYQEITGVKNFLNGLQIAGLPITKLNGYEDVIYIDANVVVRGGLTMYSTGEADIPSLADSIVTDGITILNDNGVLKINPDIQLGGITEEEMQAIVNLINTKWTTDNTKISHWDTAYSWGNHANAGYVTKQYVDDTFVTFEKDEIITGLKTFTKGIQIGNSQIKINQLQDDVLYIDSNVVIRGGLTMYYEDGEIDLPTIKDEIGNAGYDGVTGLASFNSSQFFISNDGTVTIIGGSTGLDTAQLKDYLDSNKYTTETWVKAQGYASASSLSSLQTKVNNFLEGSDTDTIINKWKELEAFLSGLSQSDNLAAILGTKANQSALDATNAILATKWTTDNDLINQWNTAYGWGNHASVGYALKSYVDDTFITIKGNEDVTGIHDFVNGLKIGNIKLSKSQEGVVYLEGNLVVKGGVTMYALDEVTVDSIIESLPLASTSQYGIAKFNPSNFVINEDGFVTIIGGSGATVKYPLSWSGFNQGSYDGSVAQSFYIPTRLSEFVNDKSFATTSDLSGYLPLSGGELSTFGFSVLTLKRKNNDTNSGIALTFANNNSNEICSIFSKESTRYLYRTDTVKNYKIWDEGNDGEGSGLDADTLDGLQPSELYVAGISEVYKENINFKKAHKKLQIISETSADSINNGFPIRYVSGLSVISNYVGWQMVSNGGADKNNPYFRKLNDTNVWSDWKQLAFLTDNVASATKLQTARTIWGQNFDGTVDVDGILYMGGRDVLSKKSNALYIGYQSAVSEALPTYLWGKGLNFINSGGQIRMLITDDGNVLIGTTTDKGYKLDVNGTMYVKSTSTVAGGIVLSGTNEGTSCITFLRENGSYIYLPKNLIIGANNNDRWYYFNRDNIFPYINNAKGLGTDTTRWSNVYSVLGDFQSNVNVGESLFINGIPIYKSQDDVLYIDGNLVVRGGVTMYAENEVDIPSIIDSLPIANANTQDKASKGIASFDSAYFKVTDGWVTLTSAPSSISTIGSLQDVSSSVSGTTNSDVVLFKSANSSTWTTKPLSEIQSSASSTVLKVSEQVMTSDVNTLGGYTGLQLLYNLNGVAIGEVGRYDAVLHVAGTSRGFQLRSVKDSSSFYVRNVTSNGFTSWNEILHSGNYSSYALPLTRAIYHTNSNNPDPNTWDGNWMGMTNQNTPDGTNYFHILSSNWGNVTQNNHKYWCTQLALPTVGSNHIFYRKGSSETTFNRWVAVLDDSNVGSYALPLSGGTVTGNVVIDGSFLVAYDSKTTWLNAIPISGSNYFNPDKSVYGNGIAHWVGDWTMRNMLHWRDGLSASGYVTGYTIGSFRRTSSFGGIFIAVSNSDGLNSVGASMEIEGNGVIGINAPNYLSTSNNLLVAGGITMYSDIRKKTKLQDVELSLSQIANAPLIQHYYNSDQNKTTHVGSIAQYWAGLNDWFCKLDNEGYYTMEIQNAALASAISIARHLERYESKTDKTIRKMKQRIQELEDKVERLKNN